MYLLGGLVLLSYGAVDAPAKEAGGNSGGSKTLWSATTLAGDLDLIS